MTPVALTDYRTLNELNLTGQILVIQTNGEQGALILDEATLTGSTGFWRVDVKHQFDHIIIRVGKGRNYRLIQAVHSRTERLDGRNPKGNNKIVYFENYSEIGISTTKSPSEFAGARMHGGYTSVNCLPVYEPVPIFADAPAPKRQGKEVIIESRPDQPDFADNVWANCRGRCVISGVAMRSRLQAAHLLSHAQLGPDHYSNGLLLRSDLHGLFDANHLAIEPSTLKVHISQVALAADPDLKQFVDNTLLSLHHAINPRYLNMRWNQFILLNPLTVAE